jgi:hypothetical protein
VEEERCIRKAPLERHNKNGASRKAQEEKHKKKGARRKAHEEMLKIKKSRDTRYFGKIDEKT